MNYCLFASKQGLLFESHALFEGVNIIGMGVNIVRICTQLERDAIYFRLSSGRRVYVDKHLKETGKSGLGRKLGYKKPKEVYEEAYKEVIKLLKKGYPIRQTAKLADVSESTVKKVKAMFGL